MWLCNHLLTIHFDLTAACDYVQNVIDDFNNLRNNSDYNFKTIYEICKLILNDVGSSVTTPR